MLSSSTRAAQGCPIVPEQEAVRGVARRQNSAGSSATSQVTVAEDLPSAPTAQPLPHAQSGLRAPSSTYRPLDGKKVLVTGGSRGIGAAIVQRLAQDGAKVAFTYAAHPEHAADVARAAQIDGEAVHPLRADAGDPQATQAAVSEAAEVLGGLDILVNNAAMLHVSPLHEMPLEHIDQMLAVNVRGTVVATQASLRHIPDGGRIINIGSVNAERVSAVNVSIYALTKGAVASFSRGLARELGPRGITVNTVQPGPIDTDMNPARGGMSEALTPLTALGRYGVGCDVAGMVSYLAGPDGGYITGAQLNIDGGFTA